LGAAQEQLFDPAFLIGGGELGALMRSHDWSASPLGAPETWPQSLRAVVGLLLGSKFPMFVAWGEELGFLYNDAYAEILGAKHPNALGSHFRDIWAEIWPDISPLIDAAMTGEAIYREDLPLVMNRRGFDEQTWFSFSYSPVRDDKGQVAGIYCACTETTAAVLAERRQAFLLRLEERLRGAAEPRAVMDTAVEALGRHLGASQVRYSEIRDDSEAIDLITCYSSGVEPIHETFRLDDGPEGIECQRRGTIEVCDDVAADPAKASETWTVIQTRAFVSVPLLDDGRFTASLCVNFEKPRRWSPEEVSLIEEVATRTWAAVKRARTEGRLRDSEARLRVSLEAAERKAAELSAVLESMPDAVYIGTAEGITLANQPALDQLGFSTREDLNRHVATLAEEIQTRDAETGKLITLEDQAFTRAFRGERVVQDVLVRHRLSGEERIVRCAAAPVMIDGQVMAAVAVNTDVTDRRRTEQALRESESRFREIADAAPVLIWISDTSKACTWFNHPWLEFTGRTMAEEHGYGWAEGVHPDDFERCVATYNDAFDRREGFRMDYRLRRHDGKYRILDDAGVARFAGDGTFLGYIGACTDVTEAREAERALRDLNDTLEQRVAERTAELEQAQEALRQSQKLEAMGQLTGGVAHDFNNLLTPIIGSLDMLTRRGLGSERERRLIDGALQSAERAKTLVQRLLAFARRQPLQPTAVDVRRLVGGMVELITSTSGPKVDVRVELPDNLPCAVADANQLEMAVLNLAVNARDAMPDGGVLTISAACGSVPSGHRSKLHQGHYVRLSVADTGTGMDEATLARAVEPFFSTKGLGKGTGLGLSMVHGLALQLNGELMISSRLGEGTTIDLWLPISSVTADVDDGTLAAAPVPRAMGTALLVDDEYLVRMSTADMLMDLGYEVVEAGSAEEALRLVGEGLIPDLLVTDHLMPGMSGAELARNLRSHRPKLPVLIVSGYAETEGIAPDLPRLTKPFRNAELAANLAAVMMGAAR
jgi:PAS domain S-box-containing protein